MSRAATPARAVAAACALVAAWAIVGTSDAAAEPAQVTVSRVGWWSDRIGATAAGDGAFEVAVGPTGDLQSIAAFELEIDVPAVGVASIELAESAALAEFGSLALCPTADEWEPADPGPLDEAPKPACADSIHLTRTIDTRVWIGDITPLVSDGGTVSLVVVPEFAPPTPISAGMLVRVEEIGVRAEAAAEPVAPTTSTTLDFSTPGGANTFEASPDSGLSIDFGPPPSGTVDLGQVSTPPIDDLGAAGGDPAADDAADADDAFFTLGPIEDETGPPRPWIRLALIVPLSAAIGVGVAFARRWMESRSEMLVT